MKSNKLKQYLLLLGTVMFLASCQIDKLFELGNVDFAATKYTGEFAVPLFHTSINIDDLLATQDSFSFLEIDNDGFMTVHYKGDVFTVSGDGLIPVISIDQEFPIADTVFEVPSPISGGDFDLDFADLKEGDISIRFQSPYAEPIEVDVKMFNLLKNGVAYVHHFSVPANGTIDLKNESLIGYRLDVVNDKIQMGYQSKKADGTFAPILPLVTIKNLNFSYVEGFFTKDFDIAIDSIRIGLLENKLNGTVKFEDPKLTMTVDNSMGVPMNAVFNEVSVLTNSGNKILLQSDYIENGIAVAYPNAAEVGQSKRTVFNFDNTNSNLKDILNQGPVQVNYDIDGDPNPDSDESIRGFFTDSSKVNINVELELPMYGTASGFTLTDTIVPNFPEVPAEFGGAELKLITDNELPLDLELQMYFVDSLNNVLTTLFDGTTNIISAADVDSDGVVLKDQNGDPIGKESVIFIDLSSETYTKIATAKKVVIETAFSTYQSGTVHVKIFSSHDINIRTGVKFKISK